MRPVDQPTQADALAITQALRTHGRMDGRRLAERIEALCRAIRKFQSDVLHLSIRHQQGRHRNTEATRARFQSAITRFVNTSDA